MGSMVGGKLVILKDQFIILIDEATDLFLPHPSACRLSIEGFLGASLGSKKKKEQGGQKICLLLKGTLTYTILGNNGIYKWEEGRKKKMKFSSDLKGTRNLPCGRGPL